MLSARQPPPRPRRTLALAALALLPTLAACSTPVAVPAAPFAADPACATVVLALPDALSDLERLEVGSQATAAWGDPTDPVVLRCGVEPLAPTTDQCVTADDGTTSVDWVAVPGPQDEQGRAPWRFTTYGRIPAVEVLVPASVTSTRSTSFLLDLGPAITQVEATRTCL